MAFVCLIGFWTSSSTTRLYRRQVPRLTSDNFMYMRQSRDTKTSVSAGHVILTPPNQWGAGGHRGNQTRDLLTKSRAFYRLSYHVFLGSKNEKCFVLEITFYWILIINDKNNLLCHLLTIVFGLTETWLRLTLHHPWQENCLTARPCIISLFPERADQITPRVPSNICRRRNNRDWGGEMDRTRCLCSSCSWIEKKNTQSTFWACSAQ